MTGLRSERYRRLSAGLASHSDVDLAGLIGNGRDRSVGVGGGAGVFDFDGVPVFAKRIPLTDRELDRPGRTTNHFDVPLHCQYGFGGPSVNAWRELAANRLVTEAVLAGETQAFPMLYHWRVLDGRPPIAAEHADIDAVVAGQGGSPAVRARLEAVADAHCCLALFSEYIPFDIAEVLRDNPIGRAVSVERQLSEVVTLLRDRQLLHMDAHFGNMRSDGSRIYLTDFGLATSPHFDLSPAEHDFVARHASYDSDYTAMRLVNWLVTDVCGMPTPAEDGAVARNEYVRRCATGRIPDDVPSQVADILARHAPAAAAMNAFVWRIFDGEWDAEYLGP